MPDSPTRQLAAWVVGVAVLAVLGVMLLRGGGGSSPPPAAPIRLHDASGGGGGAGGRVLVHVAGLVRRPGVYTLHAGARVADAVRRAGGARRRADLSAANLA